MEVQLYLAREHRCGIKIEYFTDTKAMESKVGDGPFFSVSTRNRNAVVINNHVL